MDIADIRDIADAYMESSYNHIAPEAALQPELSGVRLFDAPLIGIAAAEDALFRQFQDRKAIGPHFRLPTDWLSTARAVVSFFFPFSQVIRDSNKTDMTKPSAGWLHGRIEGQEFIRLFAKNMVDSLMAAGIAAVAPSLDEKFFANLGTDSHDVHARFTSNWSERHVAYACGLGTFSLSRGLITEKGVAGRLTSIVTAAALPPGGVHFATPEANCIMCGKCIKNCPAQAISFENGKDHERCSAFLQKMKAEFSPRLGCGKCQINVPCEYQNPHKKNRRS